jgi:hypothetical protein
MRSYFECFLTFNRARDHHEKETPRPVAHYVTRSIAKSGNGYTAIGALTLRGVTKGGADHLSIRSLERIGQALCGETGAFLDQRC